jgi:hypothetical protein
MSRAFLATRVAKWRTRLLYRLREKLPQRNAVFLRLIDVTGDAHVRNLLRRMLAVAN